LKGAAYEQIVARDGESAAARSSGGEIGAHAAAEAVPLCAVPASNVASNHIAAGIGEHSAGVQIAANFCERGDRSSASGKHSLPDRRPTAAVPLRDGQSRS